MTAAEPREERIEPDSEPIVVTDKRRLDPETGEVRPDAAAAEEAEQEVPEPEAERLARSCSPTCSG